MAKKVILKDDNIEIMPITRGELVLDSSGQQAFHSSQFLATQSQPGLMSGEDKTKLDSLEKVNKENNATIIMITHDPLTASYANEVYMINDGNIRCKLNKGDSRKEFYSKTMDMVASMGGEM